MIESEERAKHVMGMSAFGKCCLLVELADSMQREYGKSDGADLAAKFKEVSPKTLDSWNPETITRYVNVGRRLGSCNNDGVRLKDLLETWEFRMGRQACFDGITALTALAAVGFDEDIMYVALSSAYCHTWVL